MAFACVYKFTQAVNKDLKDPNLPARYDILSSNSDTKKLQEAALKRNNIAMAHLTMAMETEGAMTFVYRAMSAEWPGGLAFKVMVALHERFNPQDLTAKVEMRRLLSNVRIKSSDEPSGIFEQLSKIENMYRGTKIDDQELLATAMAAAPKEYATIVTLEASKPNVSLVSLEQAMKTLYRQTHGAKKVDGDELVLFSGVCYDCKKVGHRSKDYPQQVKPRWRWWWRQER